MYDRGGLDIAARLALAAIEAGLVHGRTDKQLIARALAIVSAGMDRYPDYDQPFDETTCAYCRRLRQLDRSEIGQPFRAIVEAWLESQRSAVPDHPELN